MVPDVLSALPVRRTARLVGSLLNSVVRSLVLAVPRTAERPRSPRTIIASCLAFRSACAARSKKQRSAGELSLSVALCSLGSLCRPFREQRSARGLPLLKFSFPPERPLPKSSEAVANCLCRLSCVPCTALLALQTLEATALEAVSSHALCALFVALKCLKPALSRAISRSLRLKARGPSTTTIAFAAHRAIAFSGQPIPPRLPSKSGTCCLPGLTVHQAASTRASRSCRRFRCRACSA
jgi:hypothetical protein